MGRPFLPEQESGESSEQRKRRSLGLRLDATQRQARSPAVTMLLSPLWLFDFSDVGGVNDFAQGLNVILKRPAPSA